MATTTPIRAPRSNKPTYRPAKAQLPFPLSLYQTTIGKKWVMGLTGLGLLGFVVAHMIGNLHLYEGPEEVNEYAHALRGLGGHLLPPSAALWVLRLGLIAMFGLHIFTAMQLTMSINTKARPVDYAGSRDYIAANFASRTMRYTGPIIGLYLLFHLADLTWGWVNPDFIHGDPYHNVVESLSNIPVALIYVVANVALAIHIFHGAWSMFQSLGINNPKLNSARRGLAAGLAGLILIGNLSFPILVQANLVDEDNRTHPFADQLHEAE